jgi:cysteine-rich repeat protein
VCGNGKLEAGEACDDGNLVSGDGCSKTCTIEPKASCGGTLTCNLGAPKCPADQVPLIKDGCYTGTCEPLAQCDVTPVCAVINTEHSCLARTDCGAVYTGTNCTKSDGTACHAGDTGCTCANYSFSSCKTKGAAAQVFQLGDGTEVNASTYLQ